MKEQFKNDCIRNQAINEDERMDPPRGTLGTGLCPRSWRRRGAWWVPWKHGRLHQGSRGQRAQPRRRPALLAMSAGVGDFGLDFTGDDAIPPLFLPRSQRLYVIGELDQHDDPTYLRPTTLPPCSPCLSCAGEWCWELS